MKKKIVLGQYQGYLSDLKKTLFLRFGLSVKPDQLVKRMNGDVVIKDVGMTDEQERRIIAWRDATIKQCTEVSKDEMSDV